ncbi:MAG TPA: formylmethanofuran dehydrogenase [Proteobacteria bacterium]|nr:formylmethanofuran dehydrogenase [Pseudomonadota bacterium]
MDRKEIAKGMLDGAIFYHGHRCPAMPLGLRAGLYALDLLGVERCRAHELHLVCESGPAHATMCFVDGAMYATGCTYGKGAAHRVNIGKNAIILVEMSSNRAVRVAVKPEFFEQAMQSEFVRLRSQGIPPQDIAPEIVNPLIDRVMSLDDGEMFNASDIFEMTIKRPVGTFDLKRCDGCGEAVFGNCVQEQNGRLICLECAGGVDKGLVK